MKKRLTAILRITLGGVFLYAGAIKVADPAGFAGSIAAYNILPYFWNYLAAAALPWIEATCGVLLIADVRTRAAAAIVAAMNLVFMAALASASYRGLEIECGCFGHSGDKSPAWLGFLRDAMFFATAVFIMRQKEVDKR